MLDLVVGAIVPSIKQQIKEAGIEIKSLDISIHLKNGKVIDINKGFILDRIKEAGYEYFATTYII